MAAGSLAQVGGGGKAAAILWPRAPKALTAFPFPRKTANPRPLCPLRGKRIALVLDILCNNCYSYVHVLLCL